MPRALVTVPYDELSNPSADLSAAIEAAFGPEGLGILVVDGVPGYSEKRSALLPLASRLAALPADALEALSDSDSHWNFGWSHGRERLEGDRPGACSRRARLVTSSRLASCGTAGAPRRADSSKGSFYANPLLDVPTEDAELVAQCVGAKHALVSPAVPHAARHARRYPHYCRPNLWPTASLPELQGALKACGSLMVQVGLLLSAHCDKYVVARGAGEAAGRLRRTIAESRCVRALRYARVVTHCLSTAASSRACCTTFQPTPAQRRARRATLHPGAGGTWTTAA